MSDIKKVEVFKYVIDKDKTKEHQHVHKKEHRCFAEFHGFGLDYEETDSGTGTFSTAIIQLEDGCLDNVEVSLIKFI